MANQNHAPDILAAKLADMAIHKAIDPADADTLRQSTACIKHLHKTVIDQSHKLIELNQLKNPEPVIDHRLDALAPMAADVKHLHDASTTDHLNHIKIINDMAELSAKVDAIQAVLQKLVTNNDLWGSITSSVVPAQTSPAPVEVISNGEPKPRVVKKPSPAKGK